MTDVVGHFRVLQGWENVKESSVNGFIRALQEQRIILVYMVDILGEELRRHQVDLLFYMVDILGQKLNRYSVDIFVSMVGFLGLELRL